MLCVCVCVCVSLGRGVRQQGIYTDCVVFCVYAPPPGVRCTAGGPRFHRRVEVKFVFFGSALVFKVDLTC